MRLLWLKSGVTELGDCHPVNKMDPETKTQAGGASETKAKVPIVLQYNSCKNSFHKLSKILEGSNQVFSQRLLDEFGRFRVWAGNAGAHRTGRVSLDYRLREASHIYEELTKLLGELNKKLKDGEF